MALHGQTPAKIEKHVDRHEPFKIGNVSAKRYETGDSIQYGQLPPFLASQLNGLSLDYTVYVVYSYQTPIGWTKISDQDDWFIPAVKYSVTTTNHQNVLRYATRS